VNGVNIIAKKAPQTTRSRQFSQSRAVQTKGSVWFAGWGCCGAGWVGVVIGIICFSIPIKEIDELAMSVSKIFFMVIPSL